MIIPERFKECRLKAGLSQVQLANQAKVAQSLVGRIEGGGANSTTHLYNFAKILKTSVEYLTGETDDPFVGLNTLPTREQVNEYLDIVQVTQIDLEYGMGATFLEHHANTKQISVSREWLQLFTKAKPENIFICRARGNSNQPDMQDGDMLICNAAARTPRMADEYWVLTYYELGMIKRLRKSEHGWRIISGNPNVPEELAVDGEMSIIGRVEAVIRRM